MGWGIGSVRIASGRQSLYFSHWSHFNFFSAISRLFSKGFVHLCSMRSMSQKNLWVRAGALLVAFFFFFNSVIASGLFSSASFQKHSGFVYTKKTSSPGKSPFQLPEENSESEKETDNKDESKNDKGSRVSFLPTSYHSSFLLISLQNETSVYVNRSHVQFAGHVPLFLAKRVLLI